MNVEIGTETAQFLFWEYLFWIYGIVSLQCMLVTPSLKQDICREKSRDRLLHTVFVHSFLCFCLSFLCQLFYYCTELWIHVKLYTVCFSSYTANEGPARIQYKCLVPVYVFPERRLLFPMFCLWEIYLFPGWVCLFCCRKNVDRSWEYINHSQTHECGN